MLIKETLNLNLESVSRSPIEERYALEELLMNAVSVPKMPWNTSVASANTIWSPGLTIWCVTART